MSSPDSSPSDPKRVVLAVQDPKLRESLSRLLAGTLVTVQYEPDLGSADPEEIEADVVVLRAESLGESSLPAVLEQAGEGDAPGVVVLGNDEDADDQVRLVAAGASAVLDASSGRSELAEQLVEIAKAEAEGGLHGPEAGGSVAEPKLADFQSQSPRMRDFLDVVRRVADSDSTLLVTGETGVGKERLARAIHSESARASGPFVAVNCGALSENLLESELFGHRKGAFTGAAGDRQGYFEAAGGGTIFLDEIGEMPQHLQVKILTVLQRHEVQPLGATEKVPVDVRIIAATNRELEADVREGRFREDLFFRLNVVSLVIPPLRERREDVVWLVGRFLRHFCEVHERPELIGVDAEAMELLLGYSWPGNVRELVNVIERAVLLCRGEEVRPADLPEVVRAGSGREAGAGSSHGASLPVLEPEALERAFELPLLEARRQMVREFERTYIERLLKRHRGSVGDVAADAQINPRTLYEKLRRLGLSKEDYR